MIRYRIPLALALALSAPAYAQIPVTDGASIAARAAEHAVTLKKWTDQYLLLKAEYEQIVATHEAITGVRGLGDVFDDPLLRQYLPVDWRQLYRAIQRGDVAGAIGEAGDILEDGMTVDPCQIDILPEHVRTQCTARRVKPATDIAIRTAALESIEKRAEQIDQLQTAIGATEDPKAIAELQARLAIEQAAIENENTRLALAQQIAEAEDRMLELRQQELQARTFSATRGVDIEPMAIGIR